MGASTGSRGPSSREIAARTKTGQYTTLAVYLVHHGDAVPSDLDATRPLSAAGREATVRVAAEAAARGMKPDVVWHSGKLRARQTAEVYWRACNPQAPFSAARGLQPDDPPRWMRDQLSGETRSIMVVGHMPHLPGLLHALTGASDPSAYSFPLHGCVALAADGDLWKELWRIGP
jgi:phosphohistidine phosphatase